MSEAKKDLQSSFGLPSIRDEGQLLFDFFYLFAISNNAKKLLYDLHMFNSDT